MSNDSELLNEFNSFWIDLDVTDLIDFHPIQLFIATWDEVPVYSADPFTVCFSQYKSLKFESWEINRHLLA